MTDEEKVLAPVDITNEDASQAVSEDAVPSQDREASPAAAAEGKPEAQRDDICRDFLKNICNRGSRCKFYHPSEGRQQNAEEHINFCIDYQNRGCMRDGCRFVHASRDEVERYKVTHEVTLPLARAIAAVSSGNTIAGIPLCKEFQTGRCNRGGARCRYWHVNIEEERERRARGLPHGPPGGGRFQGAGGPGRFPQQTPGYGGMGGPGMRRPGGPMDGEPYGKQPRLDDQRVMDLERRNGDLMKEVETLKEQLQRERGRYEDLYALFRQQSSTAKPAPPVAAAAQGYSASAAQAYGAAAAPAAQGYNASTAQTYGASANQPAYGGAYAQSAGWNANRRNW